MASLTRERRECRVYTVNRLSILLDCLQHFFVHARVPKLMHATSVVLASGNTSDGTALGAQLGLAKSVTLPTSFDHII